jgi:hypothetical protein
MTLAAGTKLGPYEILAPIGAGGILDLNAQLRVKRDEYRRLYRETGALDL